VLDSGIRKRLGRLGKRLDRIEARMRDQFVWLVALIVTVFGAVCIAGVMMAARR
jgi:hypothetical protein